MSQTTVLLDEAKIREDARNVQQKCVEKDYAALKEENKMVKWCFVDILWINEVIIFQQRTKLTLWQFLQLKATIKDWEDKHMELSEQIKVYHKSQKELEDSLVLKDHNVEVGWTICLGHTLHILAHTFLLIPHKNVSLQVLSELLADLDACDLQKGDAKVLANGEVAPGKSLSAANLGSV